MLEMDFATSCQRSRLGQVDPRNHGAPQFAQAFLARTTLIRSLMVWHGAAAGSCPSAHASIASQITCELETWLRLAIRR
jgi:hypothetical protein